MALFSKDLVNFIRILEDDSGQRLDNYLIKILKGVPKSHIHRIIRAGEVRINKKRAQADTRINVNDEIRIPPIRISQKNQNINNINNNMIPKQEFEIIFEDEYLLIINKPAGVAVHGGSGVSFGVIEQLRQSRPEAKYLELVHRLDKDTSGLLMIAKKRAALVKLHEMLRNDHPKKIYLALGIGQFLFNQNHQNNPNNHKKIKHVKYQLVKYTGAQGEKMVRVFNPNNIINNKNKDLEKYLDKPQDSYTIFELLDEFSGEKLHQVGLSHLSLLKATLKTGRTHQIRVHLQAENCPIAGDERYGDYQANKRLNKLGLKRMFLHAFQLEIDHPISGEKLLLQANLPTELESFLNNLK